MEYLEIRKQVEEATTVIEKSRSVAYAYGVVFGELISAIDELPELQQQEIIRRIQLVAKTVSKWQ